MKKIKEKQSIIVSVFLFIMIIIVTVSNIHKKNIIDSSSVDEHIKYVISEKSNDTKSEEISLDGYLFLGDSYTVLLQDTIKKHNPKAIVKAVSGVEPEYWNKHFDELPKNKKVNGVVLLIGVNGAAYPNNTPEKETLIKALVKKYKNKTIYVQEVFPVGKNFSKVNPDEFNKAIDNDNKEIKDFCEQYTNVYYINATDHLVTNDGYLKFTRDGLHISSDKQETFYNNIVVAVNSTN